jgi:cell division protease FtsH
VSKNNKKWRNVGLYAILAVVLVALATAFLDRPQNEQLTWKYSQFIQEVESQKVERVNLSVIALRRSLPREMEIAT